MAMTTMVKLIAHRISVSNPLQKSPENEEGKIVVGKQRYDIIVVYQ